jgi:hypothetical protein
MRVLLIDFDSKIPNLALMKISAWAKEKGHQVGFDIHDPDIINCSVIFSKNRGQAAGLQQMFPGKEIIYGGSGWDLKNTLPRSIEFCKPDYDLYPSTYSQGFTTRGCIRKCPFCIVPTKEGYIKPWQHPIYFHDDRFDTCMLMDNNLLSAPAWYVKDVFNWFITTGTKADAPQGYDARLLTEEYAGILKDIHHPKGLRFAWDNTREEPIVIRAIGILKDAGFNLKHDISFYVLAGYDTGFDDALYRCNRLREMGVSAFVMPYHKKDRMINRLAKWANRRWAYWSGPFEIGGRL